MLHRVVMSSVPPLSNNPYTYYAKQQDIIDGFILDKKTKKQSFSSYYNNIESIHIGSTVFNRHHRHSSEVYDEYMHVEQQKRAHQKYLQKNIPSVIRLKSKTTKHISTKTTQWIRTPFIAPYEVMTKDEDKAYDDEAFHDNEMMCTTFNWCFNTGEPITHYLIEARKENSTKRDVIFFGSDAIKLLIEKNKLFTKNTFEKLENLLF